MPPKSKKKVVTKNASSKATKSITDMQVESIGQGAKRLLGESHSAQPVHTNFLTLPVDIWSILLATLTGEEIVALAMISQSIFKIVKEIVEKLFPGIVGEKTQYGIAETLQDHESLIVTTREQMQQLEAYKGKMVVMNSNRYLDNNLDELFYEDYLDYFSAKTGGASAEKLCLLIPNTKDDYCKCEEEEEQAEEVEKETRTVVHRRGFHLNCGLRVQVCLTPIELIRLLANVSNISALEVFNDADMRKSWEDGAYSEGELEDARSSARLRRAELNGDEIGDDDSSSQEDGPKRSKKSGAGKKKAKKSSGPWYKRKWSDPNVIVLKVEERMNLKQLVEEKNIEYQQGKGFYQVTKKENVTAQKKLIVVNESSNSMLSGDEALAAIGIKKAAKFDVKPVSGFLIFVQSTSSSRILGDGTYVLYDGEGVDYEASDCDDDEDEDDSSEEEYGEDDEETIVLPLLPNLKRLNLHCFDYNVDFTYLHRIIQAAPNLEDLEIKYFESVRDSLLDVIVKNCPNFKRLHVETHVGNHDSGESEHLITDDGLARFVAGLKQLRVLSLPNSAKISGKLFQTLGVSQSLENLKIERYVFLDDLVEQDSNICFGGGVLKNLTELKLTGWMNKDVNFVDTLIATMPKLKVIEFKDSEYVIDNIDYDETPEAFAHDSAAMVKLVKHYPNLESILFEFDNRDERNRDSFSEVEKQELVDALLTKKYLRNLHLEGVFESNLGSFLPTSRLQSLVEQNAVPWYNLTSLDGWDWSSDDKEWIKLFVQICPNLTHIGHRLGDNDINLEELLKDPSFLPRIPRPEAEKTQVKKKKKEINKKSEELSQSKKKSYCEQTF